MWGNLILWSMHKIIAALSWCTLCTEYVQILSICTLSQRCTVTGESKEILIPTSPQPKTENAKQKNKGLDLVLLASGWTGLLPRLGSLDSISYPSASSLVVSYCPPPRKDAFALAFCQSPVRLQRLEKSFKTVEGHTRSFFRFDWWRVREWEETSCACARQRQVHTGSQMRCVITDGWTFWFIDISSCPCLLRKSTAQLTQDLENRLWYVFLLFFFFVSFRPWQLMDDAEQSPLHKLDGIAKMG